MRAYHRIIQDGITEFGNLHKGKEVLSFSRGGEKLVITHRTKVLTPITFKPDRVFTLSDRSKVAFQVLGSQANKYREIEADIFRAYLCPGISKLVFIVSTALEADNVSRITAIIQDGLENLGVRKDLHLFLILVIPKTVRSPTDIALDLSDQRFTKELFSKP